METTATFDPATDEFIIHTPTVQAQKYWITNGALHAHYCCVFARIINGEEDEERVSDIAFLLWSFFLDPTIFSFLGR